MHRSILLDRSLLYAQQIKKTELKNRCCDDSSSHKQKTQLLSLSWSTKPLCINSNLMGSLSRNSSCKSSNFWQHLDAPNSPQNSTLTALNYCILTLLRLQIVTGPDYVSLYHVTLPNPRVFSPSTWSSSCQQVLQFCEHTFLPSEQWPSPFNSHLHLPSNHTPSATRKFFSAVTVYSRGNSSISDSEPNHMLLQKLTLHPFPSLNFTPDANPYQASAPRIGYLSTIMIEI